MVDLCASTPDRLTFTLVVIRADNALIDLRCETILLVFHQLTFFLELHRYLRLEIASVDLRYGTTAFDIWADLSSIFPVLHFWHTSIDLPAVSTSVVSKDLELLYDHTTSVALAICKSWKDVEILLLPTLLIGLFKTNIKLRRKNNHKAAQLYLLNNANEVHIALNQNSCRFVVTFVYFFIPFNCNRVRELPTTCSIEKQQKKRHWGEVSDKHVSMSQSVQKKKKSRIKACRVEKPKRERRGGGGRITLCTKLASIENPFFIIFSLCSRQIVLWLCSLVIIRLPLTIDWICVKWEAVMVRDNGRVSGSGRVKKKGLKCNNGRKMEWVEKFGAFQDGSWQLKRLLG